MTRLATAVLPARGSARDRRPRCSRCSGISTTGRPARRALVTAARRLPLGAARHDRRLPAVLLARLQSRSGWNAGLFPLLMFGSNKGTAHAIVFPLFWHLAASIRRRRRCCRSSTGTATAKGYALGDAASVHGQRPGRELRDPVPAGLALRERAPRHVHHRHADRLLPHRSRRLEPRRRAAGAAAVRAVGEDALALRAGAAVLALRRSHRRQGDHRRRRTTAPARGGETTDAPVPAALLPPRREAGRQRRDQLHAVPAGPLPARREHARCWSRRCPRRRADRTAAAASPDRTSGTTTRTCRSASSRSCTRTSPAATPASGRASSACGSRSTRPGARRACCSRSSARTATSTRPTPGWSPATSACAGTTATASMRWCRSTGGRHSASDDDGHRAVLQSHRARRAQLGVVPLFFRARNPERSITVIPPLLTTAATSTTARASGRWTLLYFHKHDKESSLTRCSRCTGRTSAATKRDGASASRSTGTSPTRRRTVRGRCAVPLFWSDSGTWRTRGLLPIAWYTRDAAGGYASNALMPLFYQASGPDHFALFTLARRLPAFGAVAALVRARR